MAVSLGSVTGIPDADYSNFSPNPSILIVIAVFVLVYFFAFWKSTADVAPAESSSVNMLYILIGGLFIAVVIMNFMVYFFDFNVKAGIQGLFSETPTVNFEVDPGGLDGALGGGGGGTPGASGTVPVPEAIFTEEVYHVPGNKYTYGDAKAICKAYGGRLATIKDLQSAYSDGAGWCSYGWSDDQMALYPTQYEKWEKLQKIKGHKHDCGRPGVNGGYIANPNVRFGVNCYGHKPDITSQEEKDMENEPEYPKSKTDIEFDEKVAYWRTQIPNIRVSPFNHSNWNAF